ncbi:Thioredoxin reductase [Salinivirga cyanobacteriivorans]|uniref:Thioredoxin reductase n=2 Tax=Salinivirga cyanobacteriivorans TaxID=1307839 RepID=A0A0S2HV86_9BACT|nr:Thioredoxin reductase [Salinivirga cyanobacteriivorans]
MALFKSLDNLEEKAEMNKDGWPEGEAENVKCLIIGSGPAGYTAAIYAARANLSPVMYQGMEPGGQLTTTTEVENFPGYPSGITGPEMMEDLKKQAERFGTDVRWGMATKADLSKRPFKVAIDDKKVLEAETLIIATGATAKYLGLESEEKYKGSGVSACATCDGFFYKDKVVGVVGGGDTAAEEATYLAGLAKKVYLIVRKDYMRASKAMQKRVDNTKNIEILYEHNTKELYGDGVVEGAKLIYRKGQPDEKEVDIKIDGFFLAIGHTPNSKVFADYLTTDKEGYIITDSGSTKTNIPGVFASGDVQDKIYRQAVTAAGSGCQAALDAERFLGEQE